MKRRTLLRMGAGAAACLLAGHGSAVLADLEPDGMWQIYRRYRLLIVGQRDDEVASSVANAVVEVLARFLPTSRARLARAVDGRRVGLLIGTQQQDVAIMSAQDAGALFLAQPPFDDIRNVPLRLIVSFGSHVLVCREDLVANHAYLLAQTLTEHRDALHAPVAAPESVVPTHLGARAFFAGEPLPSHSSTDPRGA